MATLFIQTQKEKNDITLHTIYGVALGPGDPELLTLKALRILKEADLIFYPGSIQQGVQKSYVYPILEHHGLLHKELKGFFLEMTADRIQATETYDTVAQNISTAYRAGKKIAIVCEGDLSLYASFSYILARLNTLQLPVTLIPGITSFSLGAAQHQIPLSVLDDKIAIIPRVQTIAEIEHYFTNFDTLILMKIRSGWNQLKTQLVTKDWHFYYCEKLGTSAAHVTTDIHTIVEKEIPYFSLLIIKKENKTIQ